MTNMSDPMCVFQFCSAGVEIAVTLSFWVLLLIVNIWPPIWLR